MKFKKVFECMKTGDVVLSTTLSKARRGLRSGNVRIVRGEELDGRRKELLDRYYGMSSGVAQMYDMGDIETRFHAMVEV